MKKHLFSRTLAVCLLCPVLVRGANSGPIIIDPEYPCSFRYKDGEWFFPMGDTAYYLIAQSREVIARFIDVRRAHKLNFIRAMAMADGFWPFGGTPELPEYNVIREPALEKWDWLFDYAASREMNIELILWGYDVSGGEGLWSSPGHQRRWIDTLVHRYKDRPNLFLFTIANEFERYPDGKYQYQPADVDWARDVAARIRELDRIHPIGCHPSVWITDRDAPGQGARPFATYGGFTQRLPQVVWPLWKDSEVNVNVTQNNEGVQPRTWGSLDGHRRGLTYSSTRWRGVDYPVKWTATGWELEGAGLEDSLFEDRAHGKPVLITEFGYQHEPGYESEMNHATRQCHQPSTVRRMAWKIATSGAYFAAGFESTAVRQLKEVDVESFRPQGLEILHDFFIALPHWRMSPFRGATGGAVVLAEAGKTYVVYLPRGGATTLDLTEARGSFGVRPFNPRTGEFGAAFTLPGDGKRQLDAPNSQDWVFLLERSSTP